MNILTRYLRKPVRAFLHLLRRDLIPFSPPLGGFCEIEPSVRQEFQHVAFGAMALQKLLDEYPFDTVLDIGCGAGQHSDAFLQRGKKVTAVDYGKSIYFERNKSRITVRIGDFNTMTFDQQFDCVWASHVLEHQLNVGLFLRKVFAVTREGGVVCITVPPYQPEILGGHVTLWNAGILLYNLVLAGFDCSGASVLRYGFNISVIVQKRTAVLPELAFDNGDVDRVAAFLPAGFHEGSSGDICAYNWGPPS
jgi:SAM-dependent methyltransferase